MPRPDSLHHTTHYQMRDYTHQHSTTRIDADLLAVQVWADCWDDAHIPRTNAPVRFVPRVVAPFGLRWGVVNKWALVSPSRIAS